MDDQPTASIARFRADRPREDRILQLLAVERRRHVVARLREASAPVAVADLARRIAELETEASGAAPEREDAVHRSLYHRHVPKLAEADVVAYDPERNTVEPGDEFDAAAALLDALRAVSGE